MARKREPGIIFYSMEADHTQHPKIRLLFNEFGSDGYWIWACLLDRIYKDKGYYFDTTDVDNFELFASDICKKPIDLVQRVISGLVRRNLFDDEIHASYGILTSDRIQFNYLKATEERRRKGTDIEMISEICIIAEELDTVPYNQRVLLVSGDLTSSSVEIPDSSTEITNSSTEQSAYKSRVKKRIVKKSKVDKGIITASAEAEKYTVDQKLKFEAFTKWIEKNAPTVGKMEEPFTIDQHVKLKEKGFTPEQVSDYLIKMHNYKPLLKKNRSAYLTLLNWERMKKEREPNQSEEGTGKTMVL